MKKLLQVEDLHTSFSTLSKKIRAVRGVTFDLYQGEALGIVGESGCGKSVMAKSITRLLPPVSSKIEKGRILYKGEDILLKNEREMRKIRGNEIGMIFQDPMTSLNPTMKIGKQIVEGYALHQPHVSKQEMELRVLELLERVGIPDAESRMHQYPHELSGGMRQRVMIAIAMISAPHILIADEPTTALDVTIQAQILELLREFQQKEQMSILLITHDLSIIANFCDRVIVMYAGEIVESAPVEELFRAPKHPYTRRLLNSIPRLDLPPKRQLYSIHGSPPDLGCKLKGCSFHKRCPHTMPICQEANPKVFEVEPNHQVSCWLFDPRLTRNQEGK
jgi:oligopeptide transport system ATP-binding protein